MRISGQGSSKITVICALAFSSKAHFIQSIAFNPLERLHLEIKLPKRLPRNLQTVEITALVAIKPESIVGNSSKKAKSIPTRLEWDRLTARLAIEVMAFTGVRVGELVKIQLSDMNHALQQIRVLGKGDRERYLRDVFTHIADYPINRVADLLPWNIADCVNQKST